MAKDRNLVFLPFKFPTYFLKDNLKFPNISEPKIFTPTLQIKMESTIWFLNRANLLNYLAFKCYIINM